MKNRMLCLALLCFSQSFAQVTNPLDSQMVELTQNLNFQEVTSGILFDRGAQTARPDGYDGSASTDTIFSFDDWWLQYAAMYTGNVAAINTLDSVGMWKPEVLALIDSGILPLMVMDVDYHRLVRDSVLFFDSFNLMNDQLYDVTGRTQTPYSAHQLVSFSPRKSNWHDDLSVDFQMNTEFIISNSTKTLSSVEVDFGKGSGFQTVALNSKIKVSYSQYGVKWLKLKLTYTDGNFYFAVSKFTLESDGSDQPKSITGNYDDVVQIEHPTLSNHGAELQIDYGCTNEGEIRKPYIYVEGFNPEEFGDFNYNRLYDNPSLTDRDDLYPSWQFYQFLDWPSGYPILDELQTNNYDIIYVDFEEGAGNIVYNAQTLMEVIKWVNEQKAANCSSYPNTLVGYSMGGVVARLALTYMEDDEDAGTGPPHDVSYYVSVDSPHLGANIPRGLTASILDAESYDFLGFDVTDGIDAIQEAYDVLFSPAARQMLYYSGEGYEPLVYGHGPTYMAFQAILQAQGMPERTIKNIAIAKGNSSGNDQGFGSQAELVDIDLNSFNATGCLVNIENNLGDDLINGAGFLAGAFLFIKLGFFAQVPFPTHTDNDNTVPFDKKMDDVFGNVDLTDVTTNLLLDRAWPFAQPEAFDGNIGADTVKSHKHWLKLYGTMATAATTQPAPIPSINDWKTQRDAEEESGKNPLVIIHADYHRIKRDSALIYSLFYEQNGELYDSPNQSTSPYEAQTLFAFSPYKTTLYDSLSMDFRTSPAFFKTNTGLTVSTVEFDFDDGQGWFLMTNLNLTIIWRN